MFSGEPWKFYFKFKNSDFMLKFTGRLTQFYFYPIICHNVKMCQYRPSIYILFLFCTFYILRWKGKVSFIPIIQTYQKQENQIFLIFKEIQSGAVAKSYMRKGFLIYEEMRKYFPIYEESVRLIWLCNCSILNFLIYEENFISFLSVHAPLACRRTINLFQF